MQGLELLSTNKDKCT